MKLKKLLNNSEASTQAKLEEVCQKYEATVFCKVRLADVFSIDTNTINGDLYRFALQSHFDFVIANKDHEPQFAVEFDGPFHIKTEQMRRDRKKNELCDIFKFPVLRINAKYLDKNIEILIC